MKSNSRGCTAETLRHEIAQVMGVEPANVVNSRQSPWASLRFSGTRHEFLVRGEAPVGDDAAYLIEAHEFSLDGEIVADASLTVNADGYRVEALTVDAR